MAAPAATEGPKEPGTTGAEVLPDVALGVVVEVAGVVGFAGFSGGMAGKVFADTLGEAAGADAFAVGAAGEAGAALGTTGGVGLAGFLPYKALLGSQSLFFLDSVASVPLV